MRQHRPARISALKFFQTDLQCREIALRFPSKLYASSARIKWTSDWNYRYASFSSKKWKSKYPYKPAEFASAGFVFIGDNNDRVACFCCGKVLFNWKPADNIWSEHRRHRPSCVFLNRYSSVWRGLRSLIFERPAHSGAMNGKRPF